MYEIKLIFTLKAQRARHSIFPLLLKLFACWVIFHAFLLSSADLFSKLSFSKNSISNIIRVSNGLDPDQHRCSAGPNCLHRVLTDDKSCC